MAAVCTKRHIPNHTPENDAWIASAAIQHNLILVTRDVVDFENMKLIIRFRQPEADCAFGGMEWMQ